MQGGIQIGKVAAETGLSVDAIRFYEREGLLREPMRSEGGFRLYEQRDVQQLQFLRRAQELGFSLQEIRELLVIRDEETAACTHVRELIEHKLISVRGKLKELIRLERQLKTSLAKCDGVLRASADQEHEPCPVIDQIDKTLRR